MNKATRQNKAVKKGDKVYIINGNDKGLVGTVMSRTEDRIIVQGINVKKKHVKKGQNNQGGIIQLERPIHISKVALCVDEKKPRKVRVDYDPDGKRILVYKEGDTDVIYRPVKKHSGS